VQIETRLAAFGLAAIEDAGFILDIVAPLPNAPSMTGLRNYMDEANKYAPKLNLTVWLFLLPHAKP
jgi:hypothetical protein